MMRRTTGREGRGQNDYLLKNRLAANPLTGLATLGGTPDTGAILVRYTWNGDANGDDVVNADDYFRIDSGFLEQPPSPTYADGDFNYDYRVNADDYFLIDSTFVGQTGTLAASTDSSPLSSAPIPEPGAIGMLIAAGAFLRTRRRRSSNPAS